MERENAKEFLTALGWLTICWGRLEAYVDLVSAYLSKAGIAGPPPRAFSARLKYIRTSMGHMAFTLMREDMFRHLDHCGQLSRARNDLVHGIVTRWDDGSARTTHLCAKESGYVAISDVETSVRQVDALSEEIQLYSCLLFGWLERIKSVLHLSQGREEFELIARFNGDRE